MRRALSIGCRLAVLGVCAFAAWRSIRMARADWLASSGPLADLERAARLEPGDARIRAIDAVVRSDNGDNSTAVDRDLTEAVRLNPWDSSVLMTLGVRAEFRGDRAAAEQYLVRAAEVDRQFKPAWTLANFYFRANQPEKMWPLLKRCLDLDPLGFDTAPVFDLCWAISSDPGRILAIVPRKRPRIVEYLAYLLRTERAGPATAVWPLALSASDPAADGALLIPFPALLVQAGRTMHAVAAWNDLTARGVLHSARLDPARGVSVADPAFALTGPAGVFSWHPAEADGLFVRRLSPSVSFELDGSQPESLLLVSTVAPVLAERTYRLIWKADTSALAQPAAPGFQFRVGVDTTCPLVGASAPCEFRPTTDTARIELAYTRAPGTTRARGSLELTNARLELLP